MNKSISISNPTKVVSLIVEPVGNGNKIGGNLDLKIFTNATEIKVAALDIEDLGELPANLITFDASDNKIGNLKNFNLGTDVRTFNLKTNKLSASDIDTVLSQFNSDTLVDVGSLIDISGFGNSLVDDANRTKIAELQNQNWTVNYNNYQYTMRADSTIVEEGAILSVAIDTTAFNVRDGTDVPYTITGIQANDIDQDLTGNFVVVNNRASKNFNIKADVGIPAYQESESFTISLDEYVGQPSLTIPVIDTTPSPFALTAASSSKEGQDFNITISTVNCDVPDGTIVPYTITGIQANDIQQPLTGSFVINSNVATIPINVIADDPTDPAEGTEVLTITLDDYPTTISINLYDVTYDLKSTTDDPSDPTNFAYGGATEITSIDEGGKFYVVLQTEGLGSGSIPYLISGISASDIAEPLAGNFSVSSNIAYKEFNVSEDFKTDAGETFTLTLVNGFASTAVTIGDTSADPNIALTVSPSGSQDEGSNIDITITATELPDGYEVPYTIIGGVQAADFKASGFDGAAAPSDLKGKFTISSGTATATFKLEADATTEGTETLTLKLDDYPTNTISIDVNDTSLTPTFALSTNAATSGSPVLPTVNEGVSFDITLTTQNIADATNIPYTITGIQSTDIAGSLTGNFTISSGTATETITVTNDSFTEGEEILKLKLDSYSEEIEIRISDTSQTAFALSNDVNNLADEGDEVEFTLTTTDTVGNYGYVLSGSELGGTTLTEDDFESGTGLTTSLSGTFAANGSTVKYKLKEDNITEGTLTMVMILEDVDSDGNAEAQSIVIVNDTSIETYALTGTTTVAESGSTTITLTTQGVPDNTTVPFTISGTNITTDDFVGLSSLTGDFTVSGNTASITFDISADGIAEDATETFTLALDNGAASINVNITDSVLTLQTDATSVNEGQSFTITLNTFGLLADGAEVPYTISGTNITTDDFEGEAGASLTGSFIVQNSTATKTFTVSNDFTTESSSETFVLTLDGYGVSQTVDIVDTSLDPTFVLTSNRGTANEIGGDGTGSYFDAILTTTGVPDNTLFGYNISGSGVTTDDFDELLNNPEGVLDRNYSSVYAHTGIYYNNGTTHARSPQGQSQLDYELGSWAPAERDSRNYTTVIDFGNTEATLDVSALQNSQNRVYSGTPAQRNHMTNRGSNDVEPIVITLNNHTFSTGDEVRMTINKDFAGPIAEGSDYNTTLSQFVTEVQTESFLSGVITQTTTDTFTVQLYNTSSYYGSTSTAIQYRQNEVVPTNENGYYKSTDEMPLGTDQTAIPFVGVRLEKADEKQSLGSWMKIYTYGQEVTGITTQGRTTDMRDYDNVPGSQSIANAWVKSFRVQYRDSLAHDGITELEWIQAGNTETASNISGQGHRWFDVDNGRIFTGHGGQAAAGSTAQDPEEGSKKITNTFNTPVVATEIKIIPVTYYRWPSMRAAAVADVSLSGRSFRVFNNEARKSFKVRADLITEGTESITFTLTDSRSVSPDNTFTITALDGSINPEDMPLDIVNVGKENIITARSNDSIQTYTNVDYTADPTTLDTKLNLSSGFDVVMIDGVNWNRHYSGTSATNVYGLVYPNSTTMNKLKEFVTNGGTLISMTEHWSHTAYLHPHPSFGYSQITQISFPSQIIYDLGGITGANGGWKSITGGTSQTRIFPSQAALDINAVTNTTGGLTTVRGEGIRNSRSNGIELFGGSGLSLVHLWDGSLGHLNSGVQGKIIFMGDSNLKGYGSSAYNRYRTDLINPLFDYISRNRVY